GLVRHQWLPTNIIRNFDGISTERLFIGQDFSVVLSSDSCRLGSRPQRGAGQEERGAGNPATRGCLHLSPLASRASAYEHNVPEGTFLRAIDPMKQPGCLRARRPRPSSTWELY